MDDATATTSCRLALCVCGFAFILVVATPLIFFPSQAADKSTEQLLEKARTHAKSYRNCEVGLQEAERVIRLSPRNVEAYVIKAKCLDYLVGAKPAIETLETALRIDPKSLKCLEALGTIYGTTQRPEKSISYFSRAIAVAPGNKEYYHMRSMAYGQLKKYDLAIADMNRYIELAPGYRRGYAWRASAYEQSGEWDKAIADLNQAIKLSPDAKLEFVALRADLFAKIKKYKQAIADYDLLLQANSLDDSFWMKRAECRMALKDYGGAIKDYTETIELGETSTAYFARSKAYKEFGRHDLAQKDKATAELLLKKKVVEPL